MTNQCSDHKCQQIGVPSSCSWGRLTTSARIKEGVMGALVKYALSNIRRPLLHPKFPTSQGESSTYVDLQTQFRNKGPSSSEEDNLGDSYTTASAGSRGSAHMNIVPKGTQPESRNLHHQSQNPVAKQAWFAWPHRQCPLSAHRKARQSHLNKMRPFLGNLTSPMNWALPSHEQIWQGRGLWRWARIALW